MIERDAATVYFTGKPCKRGHTSGRRIANGDCIECSRERLRRWYAANREADLARKAEWVANNQERVRETHKAYYEANGEGIRARASRYYSENREAGTEARRRYRQSDIERLRAYDRARHAADPSRSKISRLRRRARKNGTGGVCTAADIAVICKAQRERCAYCRIALSKAVRHIDHIVPLSRGGDNNKQNIQLLCSSCNLAKHASDPIEYARRIGRLL